MEYPCSNDQGVIDLEARRLTQMSRKQSQDDGDRRQGQTDVMRNQDPTRLVVADVRKLVLSLAGVRDQGGQHFVSVPCSDCCESGLEDERGRKLPIYQEAGKASKDLHTSAQSLGGVVSRVEGGKVTPHAHGAVDLYPIVCCFGSPICSALPHQE